MAWPDTKPHDLTYSGTGQLLQIHPREACDGPCAFHAPSNHHMVSWPIHWRADRRIVERICPHGIGHPDPDNMDFIRRHHGDAAAEGEGVHGCDGCCARRR